jgi:hypothetical protein
LVAPRVQEGAQGVLSGYLGADKILPSHLTTIARGEGGETGLDLSQIVRMRLNRRPKVEDYNLPQRDRDGGAKGVGRRNSSAPGKGHDETTNGMSREPSFSK